MSYSNSIFSPWCMSAHRLSCHSSLAESQIEYECIAFFLSVWLKPQPTLKNLQSSVFFTSFGGFVIPLLIYSLFLVPLII